MAEQDLNPLNYTHFTIVLVGGKEEGKTVVLHKPGRVKRESDYRGPS